MQGDWFSWQEYTEALRGLLPLDHNRLGLQDEVTSSGKTVPGFLSRTVRQAVIDLQTVIPVYRKGHETLYLPGDFVAEGHSSRAVLPPQAEVRDAFLVNLSTHTRYPLKDFPWERRFELASGQVALIDNNGFISIDPYAYTFYVYPSLESKLLPATGFLADRHDEALPGALQCPSYSWPEKKPQPPEWVVSLFWDGTKLDFKPEEEVPFDEQSLEAVADYVKGKIAREVKNDLATYLSYLAPINPQTGQGGSYYLKRKQLYLTAKERLRTKP